MTTPQKLAVLIVTCAMVAAGGRLTAQSQTRQQLPVLEVDPTWMKVPEKMMIGLVRGLSVDSQDNVWIAQDTQRSRRWPPSDDGVTNPGEFMVVHNIDTDSQGNLYATSICDGRVQKFVYKGLR